MALTETAVHRAPPATAPVSIRVEDLHIRYRVYEERRMSTRQILSAGIRSRGAAEVHAVRGVSFEIHRGEAVGIVGPNGSGKSTLLRAIAGLQPKASGTVLVRGEPQLLSVAASFKPELSGLRNVMLGGLAMGLTLDEVEARLPDVIEFSGLGDAMRRPIKTYSSGMRARLGFSIATLKIPEILLIDEALAVGDADFRDRSLQRVNEIREAANTVVMVTHNVAEVRRTCTRAMWVEDGHLIADGDVEAVIASYVEAHSA